LEKRYLEFFQKLLESGVRGSYREFLGNTLIKYLDEDFTLTLCDLDIIDAFLDYSQEDIETILKMAKENLKKLSEK
jgi:hypothetical protein